MQPATAMPGRRAISISLALFAASMVLGSYRVFDEFMPGYAVAWSVETIFWEFSLRCVGYGPRGLPSIEHGELNLLAGATANHLFVLACLAALLARCRMAAAFSVSSALCAIGCLLPAQVRELDDGWFLGPGYFVWCAAPVVLSVAMVRIVHHRIRSHSEPLLRGFLSPRPVIRQNDRPAA